MNQNKYKCYKCNNMAVWYYMPAPDSTNNYYCDTCVSRGCSCNAIGFEDDPNMEYYKDQFGRDLPCIEYDYCETGYDENE